MTKSVYYSSDPNLLEAGVRARQTFKFFWRELSWEQRRIVPAFDLTCVKVAFAERGNVEHMWVGDVGFDGEFVTGTLMNEPNDLGSIHEGDSVRAKLSDRLSDWMLSTAGRPVLGGYTIQVLRAEMSAKERREHDDAWGLDFGDPAHVKLPEQGDDHPMALNMAASLDDYLTKNPGALNAANDEDGFTMLHRESLAGNANIVAILLKRGAKLDARTKGNKTALDLARALSWSKIESMLTAAGG
jgi:uncharacterized protein YegJ (DUF2314 family)